MLTRRAGMVSPVAFSVQVWAAGSVRGGPVGWKRPPRVSLASGVGVGTGVGVAGAALGAAAGAPVPPGAQAARRRSAAAARVARRAIIRRLYPVRSLIVQLTV